MPNLNARYAQRKEGWLLLKGDPLKTHPGKWPRSGAERVKFPCALSVVLKHTTQKRITGSSGNLRLYRYFLLRVACFQSPNLFSIFGFFLSF